MLFEGEAQVAGPAAIELLNSLLDLCQKAGVQRILTGASFPMPMSHRDPSIVYGVATDGRMLTDLTNTGLHPMSAGQISGLNGLILGHAAQRNIPAACLLATMPVYAVSLPNPKATRAVAAALTAILGIATDFTKLDMDIACMEKKLEAIETKLGELSLSSQDEEEEALPGPEPPTAPPHHVLRRIEHLFAESGEDRTKAYILKQELDRWDLYKKYEDRFLDLFKQSE